MRALLAKETARYHGEALFSPHAREGKAEGKQIKVRLSKPFTADAVEGALRRGAGL
jgi:hypothetical protein